jgi:hypothetical protein
VTSDPSEKRWSVRRPIDSVFAELDVERPEFVTNLSRTGAFIFSKEPLPVGSQVHLRFTVVLDDLEIVEGLGEVMRVVEPGGAEPSGMGIQFLELTEESRQIIERMLVRR